MDALLFLIATKFFPSLVDEDRTNRLLEGFPSTIYKARAKLLGPSVNDLVEVHMCVEGCQLFEPQGEGPVDYGEVCSKCGERRFDGNKVARSVLR
jgi:hypothetical protein